ncbi:MAG TPA: UDP-N-acetylglucosamine 1-carboxyvinyltransferase [bacterium]|nr:UDP-N-acetylglucosamine 1-carboxyvinyltransferase [bacterium]
MPVLDKLILVGGKRLEGTVQISGSKNAVLPIMAASLLADGTYTFGNVPRLRDVRTMQKLIENMGISVTLDGHTLRIYSQPCEHCEAPYDQVKTMRASIYVLGPLVGRFGRARVSLPGGCAWGPRPVNLHIDGLTRLGAKIHFEKGYIVASARRLKGARVSFDIPSVGATGNILMACVLARGTTVIENAAREPEITALAGFLNRMGARIEGIGTSRLEIEGVDELHPADTDVIPDRIETGTFLAASHLTGGDVTLEKTSPALVNSILDKLRIAGAEITETDEQIRIKSDRSIRPVDVTTSVYPGFPTDMQAQWMALMSIADGSSVITDTIYSDRFTHVAELRRLGANITLDHNVAVVKGVRTLSGAPVMSTDLRASASLILAGLVAKGRTDVSRVYHIDRGYETIEKKLQMLGAEIWREQEKLVV